MEIVQDVQEGLNHKCKTIHYELIFSENTTIVNSFNIFVSLGPRNVNYWRYFILKMLATKMHIERYFLGIWVENNEIRWKLFRGLARIHLIKSYLYIRVGSDSIGNRNNHRNSFFWYLDTRHRSLTSGNLKRTLFYGCWKFGFFFIKNSKWTWYP